MVCVDVLTLCVKIFRYRSDVGGLSPYGDRKDSLELEGVLGKRARTSTPPLSERVMLYVRQDTDDVYTPLHVAPPTTQGLLHAVSTLFLWFSRTLHRT